MISTNSVHQETQKLYSNKSYFWLCFDYTTLKITLTTLLHFQPIVPILCRHSLKNYSYIIVLSENNQFFYLLTPKMIFIPALNCTHYAISGPRDIFSHKQMHKSEPEKAMFLLDLTPCPRLCFLEIIRYNCASHKQYACYSWWDWLWLCSWWAGRCFSTPAECNVRWRLVPLDLPHSTEQASHHWCPLHISFLQNDSAEAALPTLLSALFCSSQSCASENSYRYLCMFLFCFAFFIHFGGGDVCLGPQIIEALSFTTGSSAGRGTRRWEAPKPSLQWELTGQTGRPGSQSPSP